MINRCYVQVKTAHSLCKPVFLGVFIKSRGMLNLEEKNLINFSIMTNSSSSIINNDNYGGDGIAQHYYGIIDISGETAQVQHLRQIVSDARQLTSPYVFTLWRMVVPL